MASALTKAELIARGLTFAGNTGQTTEAGYWLDALLRQLAQNYRWPEIQTSVSLSVAIGGESVALPSDFAFPIRDTVGRVGTFVDSNATRSGIYLVGLEEVKASPSHDESSTGTPTAIAIDLANGLAVFDVYPNVAGTLVMNYQKCPASVATTSTVWFSDDMALIQAIRSMAEQFDRGNLVNVALTVAEQAKNIALRAPARLKALFNAGGPGDGLDPRWFRRGGG